MSIFGCCSKKTKRTQPTKRDTSEIQRELSIKRELSLKIPAEAGYYRERRSLTQEFKTQYELLQKYVFPRSPSKEIMLIYLIFLTEAVCPSYHCLESSNSSQCYLFENEEIYVKECSEEEHCYLNYTLYSLEGNCRKKPLEVKFPGEKCDENSLCIEGDCYKGICEGRKIGDFCSQTTECDLGLACFEEECQPLKAEGETCKFNTDCVANCYCDEVCKLYFSIEIGEKTNSFEVEDFSCVSGMAYEGICIEEVVLVRDLNKTCSTDEDCWLEIEGMKFYGRCECGRDEGGNKYCGGVEVDYFRSILRGFWKEWIFSKEIAECHTLMKLNIDCVYEKKPELYEKMIWYEIKKENLAELENVEECVKKSLFPIEKVDQQGEGK